MCSSDLQDRPVSFQRHLGRVSPRVQDAPCRETTTATAIRRDLEADANGATIRNAREAARPLTGTAPAGAHTTTVQGGTATRTEAAAAAVRPAETRTMIDTMTETGPVLRAA